PEQIILFGSHAWGKPDDDNDLDFLVIVRRSRHKPTQRATRAYRALRRLFAPTDILVKTQAEVERFRRVPASLECEILERGRILYGRFKARVRAGVDSENACEAGSYSKARNSFSVN
ncbi:MAG: nucleotidyltransferase domain-containing protein, partial [Lysobacteraceae bacterium]